MHSGAIAHSGHLRGQADAGSVTLLALFKTGWDFLGNWQLSASLEEWTGHVRQRTYFGGGGVSAPKL